MKGLTIAQSILNGFLLTIIIWHICTFKQAKQTAFELGYLTHENASLVWAKESEHYNFDHKRIGVIADSLNRTSYSNPWANDQ